YNGGSALNTAYNGVAFEEVGASHQDLWPELSGRDPATNKGNAWIPRPGSAAIWGIVGSGLNGKIVPRKEVTVTTSDTRLGGMDLLNRRCTTDSLIADRTTTTDRFGIYLLTSACSGTRSTQGRTSATLSLS